MRKLKNVRDQSELSFDKHTRKIKLCCHIFFEYVNSSLCATIPEYQHAEIHDHNEGILFCPDCIIKEVEKLNEGQNNQREIYKVGLQEVKMYGLKFQLTANNVTYITLRRENDT